MALFQNLWSLQWRSSGCDLLFSIGRNTLCNRVIEYFPMNKAIRLKASSSRSGFIFKLINLKLPVVSVPVLSNTTCVMFLNNSGFLHSGTALRSWRPAQSNSNGSGVANPMAQGQAITNTAILRIKAGKALNKYQFTASVTNAMPITAGTKMALILSASCLLVVFLPCACFTTVHNIGQYRIFCRCNYLCFNGTVHQQASTLSVYLLFFGDGQTFSCNNGFINRCFAQKYFTIGWNLFATFWEWDHLVLRTLFSSGKICSWCWSSKAIIFYHHLHWLFASCWVLFAFVQRKRLPVITKEYQGDDGMPRRTCIALLVRLMPYKLQKNAADAPNATKEHSCWADHCVNF